MHNSVQRCIHCRSSTTQQPMSETLVSHKGMTPRDALHLLEPMMCSLWQQQVAFWAPCSEVSLRLARTQSRSHAARAPPSQGLAACVMTIGLASHLQCCACSSWQQRRAYSARCLLSCLLAAGTHSWPLSWVHLPRERWRSTLQALLPLAVMRMASRKSRSAPQQLPRRQYCAS